MKDSSFPRTPRKLVSKDRLIRILHRRIQQVPSGAVKRISRLSHPDENGCNWAFEIASPASLTAVYEILASARLEFNISEE
jgi:hypothetical protein